MSLTAGCPPCDEFCSVWQGWGIILVLFGLPGTAQDSIFNFSNFLFLLKVADHCIPGFLSTTGLAFHSDDWPQRSRRSWIQPPSEGEQTDLRTWTFWHVEQLDPSSLISLPLTSLLKADTEPASSSPRIIFLSFSSEGTVRIQLLPQPRVSVGR